MKRALIISGITGLGLLIPTGAMAGSLNNNFGASSSEFTGTSTGTSTINVKSDIYIDNEVNIQSHTHSASLDLNGNNGRLIHRDEGQAHYSDNSGQASGALDYQGSNASEHASHHEASGELDIKASASTESNESAKVKESAKGWDSDAADENSWMTSLTPGKGKGKGDDTSSESASGELSVDIEGQKASNQNSSNSGWVQGDATAGGSFSTQNNGWTGTQSETAVDGQFSASVQSGTTDIHGTIRESGLTTTTVDLTSITTGTSFGSEAKSFRNASF